MIFCLFGTRAADENQLDTAARPDTFCYLLVVVATLALILRRRAPLWALAICGAALTVYLSKDYPFGPVLFTGPVAAWAVGSRLPWRRALPAVGIFAVVVAAGAAGRLLDGGGAGWLAFTGWVLIWSLVVGSAAVAGAAITERRRSAEGVRLEQARRAVSEERLAMAQDVHDGVGHGLAVIALQAGVAMHVLDRDPQRARELLATIQSTSRESLDGLRADLERLRSPESTAARRPAPGLADLPVLLDRMRDGGLILRTDLAGVPSGAEDPLPAEVDAAAYRIVQESLTNVLRHADTSEATVRIVRDGTTLRIDVRDRGRTPVRERSVGTGATGIDGMRGRAETAGGTLSAGPAEDGGFLVRAALPLTTSSIGAHHD